MSLLTRREILAGALTGVVFNSLSAAHGAQKDGNKRPELLMPVSKLPIPFRPNDVVLFQGDSITDGGRWKEGQDFNHIMGQDYCYMISGALGAQYAEANLTFLNRGWGGNGVKDLAGRWQSDTLNPKPNLVSILIGVNDVGATVGKVNPADGAAQFGQVYEQLIQQTQNALPNTHIVLGQPFVLPVGPRKDDYALWRAQIEPMQSVVRDLTKKYALPFVTYQDAFDAASRIVAADHWSWDGVHPTYAGHYLMADLWLKTVQEFYRRS